MSAHEATVEVLTAEVRALMVGSRQITLSVFKQLDRVDASDLEPFGRVRSGKEDNELVGRSLITGSLVRSTTPRRPNLSECFDAWYDEPDAKPFLRVPDQYLRHDYAKNQDVITVTLLGHDLTIRAKWCHRVSVSDGLDPDEFRRLSVVEHERLHEVHKKRQVEFIKETSEHALDVLRNVLLMVETEMALIERLKALPLIVLAGLR